VLPPILALWAATQVPASSGVLQLDCFPIFSAFAAGFAESASAGQAVFAAGWQNPLQRDGRGDAANGETRRLRGTATTARQAAVD